MRNSSAFTDHMKYGKGEISPEIAAVFSSLLEEDGILVFKNQEFRPVPGFVQYDYLIQDNGFQPDGFRLSKPKARPNHCFWMIFKKGNF